MQDREYTYRYPHPAVTADCVIFGWDGSDLRVLLIERGAEPYKGCWAFPGGFMEINETAEECARRELEEETGLHHADVEQFHTFTSVGRDPRERVITVAHYSLVRISEVKAGDDAAKARWFKLDKIPGLAFDHREILETALARLKENIFFKPVVFELLPDTFTMTGLQHLYESILSTQFDRRNFASKMKKLGILTEVSGREAGTPGRVPLRYRFDRQKYEEIKSKGYRLEF